MYVCFEGERRELRSLYGKMKRLQERKKYFDTIAEASNHLSAYIGKPIAATWQALSEAADEWNDEHPDADWSVNVKQIEVISNDELWA